MKAIKPIIISEGKLASSTIPEPDINAGEVEWEVGTNVSEVSGVVDTIYNMGSGDGVIVATNGGSVITVYDSIPDFSTFSARFEVSYARGVDISNNIIYVLADPPGEVLAYSLEGELLPGGLGSFDISAHGESFNGLATDGSYIYIAGVDTTTPFENKIYVYTMGGFFVREFSIDEIVDNVVDLCIADGFLYVTQDSPAFVYKIDLSDLSYTRDFYDAVLCAGITHLDNKIYINTRPQNTPQLLPYEILGFYKTGQPSNAADVGDVRIVSSEHKKYQAAALNTDDPLSGTLLTPPTWVEVGATNRYAAFDQVVSSASVGQSPMVVELTPGELFDSISCLNVGGASDINIVVTDPVFGEVYNESIEMTDNTEISDWYQYLWAGFELSTSFVKLDLPPYANATVKITLTGADEISLGVLVVGKSVTLGEANYGSSIQQLNFSRVEEDEFGSINVVKRPGAKLVNYDVSVMKTRLNYTYNQLEELRDIPTVWVGTSSVQDETLVYGYHVDNKLNIDSPTICSVDLTIRGLI